MQFITDTSIWKNMESLLPKRYYIVNVETHQYREVPDLVNLKTNEILVFVTFIKQDDNPRFTVRLVEPYLEKFYIHHNVKVDAMSVKEIVNKDPNYYSSMTLENIKVLLIVYIIYQTEIKVLRDLNYDLVDSALYELYLKINTDYFGYTDNDMMYARDVYLEPKK